MTCLDDNALASADHLKASAKKLLKQPFLDYATPLQRILLALLKKTYKYALTKRTLNAIDNLDRTIFFQAIDIDLDHVNQDITHHQPAAKQAEHTYVKRSHDYQRLADETEQAYTLIQRIRTSSTPNSEDLALARRYYDQRATDAAIAKKLLENAATQYKEAEALLAALQRRKHTLTQAIDLYKSACDTIALRHTHDALHTSQEENQRLEDVIEQTLGSDARADETYKNMERDQ